MNETSEKDLLPSKFQTHDESCGSWEGYVGRKFLRALHMIAVLALLQSAVGSAAAGNAVVPPGPSFDCANASRPDEKVICVNPGLSELDRLTSKAFEEAKAIDKEKAIETARAFLRRRASCNGDVDCISASQSEVLKTYGAISVPRAPAAVSLGIAQSASADAHPPDGDPSTSYSDPFAYCRVVRTLDAPDARYKGIGVAPEIASALNMPAGGQGQVTWRCLDGMLLACAAVNVDSCGKAPWLAQPPPAPTPDMVAWCRANPGSYVIPATHAHWRCVGALATLKREEFGVDARGFRPGDWVQVAKAGVQPEPSDYWVNVFKDWMRGSTAKAICKGYDGDGSYAISEVVGRDTSAVKTNFTITYPGPFDVGIFRQKETLRRFLDFAYADVLQYCRGAVASGQVKGPLPARVVVGINAGVASEMLGRGGAPHISVFWTAGDGKWAVLPPYGDDISAALEQMRRDENDALAKQIAEQNKQRIAVAQAAAAEKARQKAIEDLQTRFGIQTWVKRQEILANPFLNKGKVVAIRGNFLRMLTESDAIVGEFYFGNPGPDSLIIADFPNTLYRGNERLIVAAKVKGTRTLNGTSVPDLGYVGSYRCSQPDCEEIFGR